jgi:hypothetical protein
MEALYYNGRGSMPLFIYYNGSGMRLFFIIIGEIGLFINYNKSKVKQSLYMPWRCLGEEEV